MNHLSAVEILGDFAGQTGWHALSKPVQTEASRAWVNWVGCAIGGSQTPSMNAAVQGIVAMQFAQPGEFPVVGRRERVGLADSALLSCLSSSAHTFDDTHLATITHPTGPVAAAILSAATHLSMQNKPVTGQEFLAALMVGMEIECRLSTAIAAGGGNGGWFMTGLTGGVGAAAAVGRLLRLTPVQLQYAMGLAAAQAGGTRATHGSMAITYVPGMAARNGLSAAYMALADFTCGAGAVDGKNGLMQVLTGSTDARRACDKLGTDWEVLSNAYKPYPCGIVIHPVIDACLELVESQRVDVSNIEKVDIYAHPDTLRLCWRKLPTNVLDAQVSVYHWAAAALVRGSSGLLEGQLDCIVDPSVRAIQDRISVTSDEEIMANQARLVVVKKDKTRVECFIANGKGSVTNPMSDKDLSDKFLVQVKSLVDESAASSLLEKCWNASTAIDIALTLSLLDGVM